MCPGDATPQGRGVQVEVSQVAGKLPVSQAPRQDLVLLDIGLPLHPETSRWSLQGQSCRGNPRLKQWLLELGHAFVNYCMFGVPR